MSQIDQLWMLVCAALVFVMQAGFMCVEAGVTRSKNNISVAIKNISDLALSVLLYWALGYGLMFGTGLGGLIGATGFAFDTLDTGDAHVHFIFQAMFCGTAATILSGAVAERCAFHAYLLITAITVTVIYPVFGHWAWNVDAAGDPAGWLGAAGFHDYAGSGVVHAVGGGMALAAILVIGPRDGRFLENGQPRRFNGSDVPMTAFGVLLLWFGWVGFNGGSMLGLTDRVPAVLLNTFMSGAMGVVSAMGLSWAVSGKPSVFYGLNGALGGLVAVTGGCDIFTVREALAVGAVGGAIVFYGDRWLERMRVDDAVGAVPVHLFCGLWGLLAVALFGADLPELGTGSQLLTQLLGIAALLTWAVALPLGLLFMLNRIVPLRVTRHIETIGLNVGEHGANTDLNELFYVMQRQVRTRDMAIRAPQSPFTEVGQIGLFYNSVLFELEKSFSRTQTQQEDLARALAQKKSILESILPKRIAERMQAGDTQIVDQVADGTVVFIDIVDFTSFAATATPEQSMTLLKDLFGRYDEVIRRFDLEKIKTIGDSYMFVAGVTQDMPDHCATAVDAALEVLFETRQIGLTLDRDLQVRIGVHSGPLLAGLVGDLRFVYDLWGITVNTAARIEEVGKPGKVSVSEAVIERIGTEFVYEKQARVRLKGIGPTILYSVEGRRSMVKQDGAR